MCKNCIDQLGGDAALYFRRERIKVGVMEWLNEQNRQRTEQKNDDEMFFNFAKNICNVINNTLLITSPTKVTLTRFDFSKN